MQAVRDAAGPLLDELWWFDEFRGAQLPAQHRSLAFRLRLQDAGRQLNDQDAEAVLKAVEVAVGAIGAALRA
jgi:phenylalanyl-tRNA synthetase beta chain